MAIKSRSFPVIELFAIGVVFLSCVAHWSQAQSSSPPPARYSFSSICWNGQGVAGAAVQSVRIRAVDRNGKVIAESYAGEEGEGPVLDIPLQDGVSSGQALKIEVEINGRPVRVARLDIPGPSSGSSGLDGPAWFVVGTSGNQSNVYLEVSSDLLPVYALDVSGRFRVGVYNPVSGEYAAVGRGYRWDSLHSVWEHCLLLQRFDGGSGQPLGDPSVLTPWSSFPVDGFEVGTRLALAFDPNTNSYVVSWNEGGMTEVHGEEVWVPHKLLVRRFDSFGSAVGRALELEGSSYLESLTYNPARSEYLVTYLDPDRGELSGRILSASNLSPVGGEERLLNAADWDELRTGKVAVSQAGREYLHVFRGNESLGEDGGIYAQLIDANALKVRREAQKIGGAREAFDAAEQKLLHVNSEPTIVSEPDGGYFVSWNEFDACESVEPGSWECLGNTNKFVRLSPEAQETDSWETTGYWGRTRGLAPAPASVIDRQDWIIRTWHDVGMTENGMLEDRSLSVGHTLVNSPLSGLGSPSVSLDVLTPNEEEGEALAIYGAYDQSGAWLGYKAHLLSSSVSEPSRPVPGVVLTAVGFGRKRVPPMERVEWLLESELAIDQGPALPSSWRLELNQGTADFRQYSIGDRVMASTWTLKTDFFGAFHPVAKLGLGYFVEEVLERRMKLAARLVDYEVDPNFGRSLDAGLKAELDRLVSDGSTLLEASLGDGPGGIGMTFVTSPTGTVRELFQTGGEAPGYSTRIILEDRFDTRLYTTPSGGAITARTDFFSDDRVVAGPVTQFLTVGEEAELVASPNPIQVCDGTGLGVTTLSWTVPEGRRGKILVGSPTGNVFKSGIEGSGSGQTGKWVSNGMKFYLVDYDSGETLASLTVEVTTAGCGGGGLEATLTASPNPIQVCDGTGLGVTTLSWTVPEGRRGKILVGSPTGNVFKSGIVGSGSAETGKWARNGTKFYLVDYNSGETLASLAVEVTIAGCGPSEATLTASPNPIQVCDQTGFGVTTLNWTVPAGKKAKILLYSPTGNAFKSGIVGSGSAPTGKWVKHGMKFYLVDYDSGETLASLTVNLTTAGCPLWASPNPIRNCGGYGLDTLGVTTLSWNVPEGRRGKITVDSPSGNVFKSGIVGSGSASTGKWVSSEMKFYLVDYDSGETLAFLRMRMTTAGCGGGPTGSYGIEFVEIPAGTFQMGSNNGQSREQPVHTVNITKGFQMGKYEVTQKQWHDVMGTDPSSFTGDDRPAEMVTWEETQEFIAGLNAMNDGWTYRLPTEAEWEYAARAGSTTEYYWGDSVDGAYAWYGDNSGGQTHDVGTTLPNAWGLFDMSGNVAEWCQDWYSATYYSSSPTNDPPGPSSGSDRVIRDGGWPDDADLLRSAYRRFSWPDARDSSLGLRLVRTKSSGAEVGPYGIEFVEAPVGTFQMGSANGRSDEQPVHTVNIMKGFQIGKYEVTQKQWRDVMGTDPSSFTGDNRPVEMVSWEDAQAFIAGLNALNDGWTYRLPTEAEWEYAARAGSTTEYYWGDSFDGAYAWYGDNSGGQTHDVGTTLPNAWGLFDMSGNVSEWCQDWYGELYYESSPTNDPPGPSSGTDRVMRGGGRTDDADLLRSAYRNFSWPDARDNSVGFRLVRTKSSSAVAGPYWIEFVEIPAGTFLMGNKLDEECKEWWIHGWRLCDEMPAHTVNITKGFQMGKYEVTQKQWRDVMGTVPNTTGQIAVGAWHGLLGTDPSYFTGDNLPVEQVSWQNIQHFLKALNALNDGWTYRLPTEAEWEYAARAGSTTEYYWGDSFDEAYAWPWGNHTHHVGTKLPNAWGLFDIAGNVSEWCQDWYSWNYYASSPTNDPPGPSTGSKRVFRGGKSASRMHDGPGELHHRLGFRLVRTAN